MRRKTPEYIIQRARELRSHQTEAELELWKRIRNKQLEGFRILRQYIIGRYIADFYCSSAKLVIEIDGKIHDSSERKEYDKIREEAIRAYGIKVIRFTNDEIFHSMDSVLKTLLDSLKINLEKSSNSSP